MDFRPFDADNHYYEDLDAFTRHLDPEFKDRGVHPVRDGKGAAAHGGKVDTFIPNPTFDPIIEPGCLDPLFRGRSRRGDPRSLFRSSRWPTTRSTRARAAPGRMTTRAWRALLFPTLGCGARKRSPRHRRHHGQPRCLRRWLDEDCGFGTDGHLFGVPMLSLAKPRAAATEVNWLFELGARIVHVRPAPVPAANGAGGRWAAGRMMPSGSPRRGRRPCRLPPGRQRLRGPVGRPGAAGPFGYGRASRWVTC